jgi:hypothetical protein
MDNANVVEFDLNPDCDPSHQSLAWMLMKYGPVTATQNDFERVYGKKLRITLADGANENDGDAEVTLEVVEE